MISLSVIWKTRNAKTEFFFFYLIFEFQISSKTTIGCCPSAQWYSSWTQVFSFACVWLIFWWFVVNQTVMLWEERPSMSGGIKLYSPVLVSKMIRSYNDCPLKTSALCQALDMEADLSKTSEISALCVCKSRGVTKA